VKLSWEEVARLALEAGWNKDEAPIAVAIARGESGFRTAAVNPTSGATGLWQVLPSAHREKFTKRTDLLVPVKNAAIAYRIYEERLQRTGEAWVDWRVFRTGKHRRHLPRAETAVERVYRGQDAPLYKYDPERWLEDRDIPYVSDALGSGPKNMPDIAGAVAAGVSSLWPVLLNAALASTGLALIAFGLVKGVGASAKTKEVVTKAAPVAAGVAK
jgi:hypothetical protein